MEDALEPKQADKIRRYVRTVYIDPARQRGESLVEVVCRDVLKQLDLKGETAPAVCTALKAKVFINENRLRLERIEGPPKKMSTTVKFTFRLLGNQPGEASASAFQRLRGIAKDAFAELGGGEAFIRKERETFHGPEDNQ